MRLESPTASTAGVARSACADERTNTSISCWQGAALHECLHPGTDNIGLLALIREHADFRRRSVEHRHGVPTVLVVAVGVNDLRTERLVLPVLGSGATCGS